LQRRRAVAIEVRDVSRLAAVIAATSQTPGVDVATLRYSIRDLGAAEVSTNASAFDHSRTRADIVAAANRLHVASAVPDRRDTNDGLALPSEGLVLAMASRHALNLAVIQIPTAVNINAFETTTFSLEP
ncbi:MAG: hypothetical protein JO164_09875, partial [Candidatus Eremiobacteraeota bacterium]|nr:hypothetical protein [Candidatus Eremiobacteraeota bacterium]